MALSFTDIANLQPWEMQNLRPKAEQTFPLQPFLDRVIVEVIPISQYYEHSGNVDVLLDRTFSERSDRGIVKSLGFDGQGSIEVGDTVQFDPETAYAGLIYLNPADKKRKDKPEYLEIRIGDLLGRITK